MCEFIDAIKLNFDEDKLFLLNLILAFLMFGISLNLKIADFKRILETPRKALAGFLSQYAALPIVTYLLVLVMKPCPSIAMGIFLLGACPGGNMSNFLSHLAKGNVALSVTLSVFQTVLAPITTPLIFALCANNYEPTQQLMQEINIDTLKLMKEIFIILGIPLALG
ncbi:MAG: bile acid:sodium symporter, partial [Fimbriimonadaceae bacterium]|nr:bile acid:sodium symporter [Chitinophagales bacterium]